MRGAAQKESGTSDRLHFPSLEPVRTGMPELCRVGLSENWLLKACGHRHWLALAEAHGLTKPLFRAREGGRLYPAFTHVAIREARLCMVAEDQRLDFAVTLRRISRTRFQSEIELVCDGEPIALISMETAFVRRAVEGSNRSAHRALVAGLCRLLPDASCRRSSTLPGWPGGDAIATMILDPSPQEDFNGVGFLYFSAFQAMLDRAEWHWFRQAASPLVTVARDIAYSGNAELGDRIRATLRAERREGDTLSHQIDLSRCSDGAVIARATTHRIPIDGRSAKMVRP